MRRLLRDIILLASLGYLALPPNRNLLRPPGFVSQTILDRNGIVLREVRSSEQGVAQWMPLHQMSPALVQATIAAEDRRFYFHPGVDPLAILRSLKSNLKARRIVAGGSTITQQLIHNLYRLPRRNLLSKLLTVPEAIRFELHLSKPQILECYLNRVPYGNQAFGVEAAARLYFSKSSSELSLAEAAFLAAIPRSPSAYDPYRHPERTRQRQQAIIRALYQQKIITEQQQDLALKQQLCLTPRKNNFRAPHFTNWLIARGVTSPNGRVRTTLDWEIQKMVENRLQRHLRALRGNNVTNGAVIVMKPRTGEIVALVGSADFFDERHDGQVNAALSRRQPGSTLKPFTYELALEDGATASELLPDIQFSALEQSGDYTPRNYDEKFHGPVRLRTALACSYNVPTVRIAERISPDRLLARLHQLGFVSLDKPARHYGLALTLGVGDVTLLELCRAYACLANQGRYVSEQIVLPDYPAFLMSKGGIRMMHQGRNPAPEPVVLSPAAAAIITDILSDNTARAPAFGEHSCLNLGFPCAVKTGTSKDYRDNWTIGFTTEYLVGVWIGNFDGSPMHGVSGVTGAAPLFRDIMLALHPVPPAPFILPEEIVVRTICPKSGALCGTDCPNHMTELFVAGTEPDSCCPVHQRIASWDPVTGKVTEKVYEVYPPEYHSWMMSVGLPLPPVAEDRCDSTAANRVTITFPRNNSVFHFDPDLTREFQSLQLSARAPVGCHYVTWLVNDSVVAQSGPPFTSYWQVRPGRHRIRCVAADQSTDEVTVVVVN